ncbi:MAG TPA: hypothetical protein VH877_25045 [Polyangia bacterium]|jgi:hypothetical protein|nr:hypothetical protein [Polyangia bacterium]
MEDEFSAERVTLQVLQHLERRRAAIVHDEDKVQAAVADALVPVRRSYEEAELPPAYLTGLEEEVRAAVPAAWHAVAAPYTELERRDFGLWRGGDPVARITYVFLGLLLGGICVALPFIPIWEKWFPFALAFAAYWLPTLQMAWHRRRYAGALGAIAVRLGGAQAALDSRIRTEDLLLPEHRTAQDQSPSLNPPGQGRDQGEPRG